jgi:cytochrome c oxidase cbb3-type subunit III
MDRVNRFVLLLAVFAMNVFAQGRGGQGTREFLGLGAPPDPVAAERGEKLYTPNCAFCHGLKANGAEGPDLVRSPLVLHDEKADLIGPLLLQGRPDKGMPAFASMTAAQVSDIAQFLHMRVELSVNRGLYKVQNIVVGDAKAGEAYFNAHCKTCHANDLAHVATKFAPVDLQAAFLWPASGRGRGARSTKVTIALSNGQTITGTVKRLDDFDVSIVDAEGAYHSWPRDRVKVEIPDPLVGHRELLAKYTDEDMHNLLSYLVTLK